MADTVGTSVRCGLNASPIESDIEADTFDPQDLSQADDPNAEGFQGRSMEQRDHCPFVLPRRAVAKLRFTQEAVGSGGTAPA